MWRFGRRGRMTPVVPVDEEPQPRRRWRFGGTFLPQWRRRNTHTQKPSMHPPAAVFLDREGDHQENARFLMPEHVADWPNFMLETMYRPLWLPLPGHVEGSDLNEFMNTSMENLTRLAAEGLPGVAEDDDADDNPNVEPGAIGHSASAQIHFWGSCYNAGW